MLAKRFVDVCHQNNFLKGGWFGCCLMTVCTFFCFRSPTNFTNHRVVITTNNQTLKVNFVVLYTPNKMYIKVNVLTNTHT